MFHSDCGDKDDVKGDRQVAAQRGERQRAPLMSDRAAVASKGEGSARAGADITGGVVSGLSLLLFS
jgi:hypothetical protein